MQKIFLSLFFVAFLAIFSAQNATAQRTLTGKVVDKKNAPIVGAGVVLKGTTTGTITDGSGNFSLAADNINVVVVTFATETQELAIKPADKNVQIQFKSTLKQLQKDLDKLNKGKGKVKKR